MKKPFLLVALPVLLVGYGVAQLTRVKSQTAIMDLVGDINAEHARLSSSAARHTYATLHKLWYTQGALPDSPDHICASILE